LPATRWNEARERQAIEIVERAINAERINPGGRK